MDLPQDHCPDCVADRGLCRAHAREILPQLKLPSWPRLIGDQYACNAEMCGEHATCIDVPEHAAPRAGCGCHNCGQRRATRATAKESPDGDTQRQVQRVKRRNARKAEKAPRFARAIAGEFTPVRHSHGNA